MTTEKAIEILTNEIKCRNFDEDLCVIGTACDGCEYNVGFVELTEAMKTMISRWEHLKKYLKDQELLYSVNYKDIEKHEMIVSVIEEMEHDPD